MSDHLTPVTLVGLGAISLEYAKVLNALGNPVIAIGRSEQSCTQFSEKSKIQSFSGGVLKNKLSVSEHAIVSASVESLAEITTQLINCGTKQLLIEKPGALSKQELIDIKNLADKEKAKVYIAYNRRFLSSTQELCRRISAEGGLQTGCFEFTEWSHVIDQLPESMAKKTTFLSNSTHVIDLAFYLMGKPTQYSTYTAGEKMFPWNPGPSRFVGAGLTENKVLFSYHSNWTSAGRWGVEVLTSKSRYILRPLEKLFRQAVGSVQIEEITLPPSVASDFKPGLYDQVNAFLKAGSTSHTKDLVTIEEQIEMFDHYNKINAAQL